MVLSNYEILLPTFPTIVPSAYHPLAEVQIFEDYQVNPVPVAEQMVFRLKLHDVLSPAFETCVENPLSVR